MTPLAPRISAAILVGGKSRRMGADKALLHVGGQPIIQRMAAVVRTVTTDLLLIGAGAERYAFVGGRAADDLIPRSGPLAGIYTALSMAHSSRCLVLACDMPFLNADLLRYMSERESDWDVLLPRLPDGHVEPLHAIYSRACIGPIETMLRQGRLCPLDLYPQVRTEYLEAAEIALSDPYYRSFVNLNTPADLAHAQEAATAPREWGLPARPRPSVTIVSETLWKKGVEECL